MKKTLQDLTIRDSFMFAAAMSNTDCSREFLTILLGIQILEISVIPENNVTINDGHTTIWLNTEGNNDAKDS